MKSFLTRYFFPLCLICIVGILCLANYTPDTFLTGWDTLHPELNFSLAISRIIHGVWRTDQGLGAVAIQSHMAELPRLIFLWLESHILPVSMLRYSYFFLMLLSGPLGIYVFTKTFLPKKSLAAPAAWISALIYLCNLTTLQQFVVPLEMFATQYGLLPWLLLLFFKLLEKPSKKIALLFAGLSFFAASQAHTATLFYTYTLILFLISLSYVAIHTNRLITIKKITLIFAIIFCTNAFWILPNIYAAATHGLQVRESKINQLFSPEAFAKNQEFGTMDNALITRNFLFDWSLYDNANHKFVQILTPWMAHLSNPFTVMIGYGAAGLAIAGLWLSKRNKYTLFLSLTPLFVVPFFMLLNGTWPMTAAFDLLGNISPIAREALRFPFTKFSILYIAGLAIFAGIAIQTILLSLSRHRKIAASVTTIALTGALIWYFAPAFGGNLIHPAMRVTIPKEYQEMFTWFESQDHTDRVALLPVQTFWNWIYYRWGYQGAGFLQFGIPQPILDRDYDRWSPQNEAYTREMAFALYSQDPSNVHAVVNKYHVRWLLLDTSVFSPGDNENTTLLWLLPDLLAKSGFTQANQFGNHLYIFENKTRATNEVAFDPWGGLTDRTERVTQPFRGSLVAQLSKTDLSGTEPYSCGLHAAQPEAKKITETGIEYTSVDMPICDNVSFPNLSHAQAYVIEIQSKNTSGFPLQLCVSNTLTHHCDLNVYLGTHKTPQTERFLLPPLSDFGSGHSLNFNNYTITGRTSVNEIQNIRIRQITIPQPIQKSSPILPTVSTKIFSGFWKISVAESAFGTLTIPEAYDTGWIAFRRIENPTRFFPLSGHTIINGWENGWVENYAKSDTIYIIFWPQILEWVGFTLLPVPFIWLLISKRKDYETFS